MKSRVSEIKFLWWDKFFFDYSWKENMWVEGWFLGIFIDYKTKRKRIYNKCINLI